MRKDASFDSPRRWIDTSQEAKSVGSHPIGPGSTWHNLNESSIRHGDQPISCIDQLNRVLTERQVGVHSSLTVIRRGEKRVLPIVPEESRVR